MRKKMANVTKTKKLDLELGKKKGKKDCNSIYIVLRKMRVKLKRQAKK